MRKGCRNCWTSILLEHFWNKAFSVIQFALSLFLRNLIFSILSFVTGQSLFVKRPLVKKCRSGYYCANPTFCGRTLWGKRFLVKNPLAVVGFDCFQTFIEKENFFEKHLLFLLKC
jgi:hypothetical protein